MLSVAEAMRFLRDHVPPLSVEAVECGRAHGRFLAEEITSDIDLPPFDRSMMDGYAVRSADPSGREVIEDIPAGKVSHVEVGPGQCSKIMTGAPLPPGADAVQQVEKIQREGVRIHLSEPVLPGQNVAAKGEDLRAGDRVLSPGKCLQPADLGLLATVGRTSISVYRRPSVAILVTGDEVVEPGVDPAPGQIRNANGPFLRAQCESAGFETTYLGIVKDREAELGQKLREGLEKDVLIITGGVSAGDWDLVIPCLEREGVTSQFHKVRIKPGKPLFFGSRGKTRVFGLPGNPVSSFVTFEVFLRPFLCWMMGGEYSRPCFRIPLCGEISHSSDRQRYLPASYEGGEVSPVRWNGSGDLSGMSGANCFIIVPVGTMYKDGDHVDVLLLI